VLDGLQFIQGESNETYSRLYARLPIAAIAESQTAREAADVAVGTQLAAAAGFTLRGEVSGPFSVRGHTLPATSVFTPLSTAADDAISVAADATAISVEAMVPDPCYWSPRAPLQYRASLAVCDARGEVVQKRTFNVGLRMAGVRRSSFFFNGERWVLRGVVAETAALAEFDNQPENRDALLEELDAWREAKTSLCIRCTGGPLPTALLEAASEQGVIVHALVDTPAIVPTLAQLRTYAAVAFAAVRDSASLDASTLRQVAPNMVLSQWLQPGDETAAWAQALFLDASSPELAGPVAAAAELPVIAFRNTAQADLAAVRAGCDLLQRELAQSADCAGYVVWPR